MPRVLARTPNWLVPPSPGSDLFATRVSKTQDAPASQKEHEYHGPSRTIAHGRGTEVFVAQGNEVRWADLKHLKDSCDETEEADGQSKRRSAAWRYKDSFDSAYRVRIRRR
jgi:nucleoporin NUP82